MTFLLPGDVSQEEINIRTKTYYELSEMQLCEEFIEL